MKVFISWSGDHSRPVAEKLHWFLKQLDCDFDPWLSSVDIKAGKRWRDELKASLNSSGLGVLCLTPQALQSPWVLFEAGALSQSNHRGELFPYLIGLDKGISDGPLSQFQSKQCTREGTSELVDGLLPQPGSRPCAAAKFDFNWPELELAISHTLQQLKKLPNERASHRLDWTGLNELFDIYLDAVAQRLLTMFRRYLKDSAFRAYLKDFSSIRAADVKAKIEVLHSVVMANPPGASITELLNMLEGQDAPRPLVDIIQDADATIQKSRSQLEVFHNDAIPDIPQYLARRLPPYMLVDCVLTGVKVVANCKPDARLDAIYKHIERKQAHLRQTILKLKNRPSTQGKPRTTRKKRIDHPPEVAFALEMSSVS